MLLWLVMIALPTQGFASALMIDCGESHHHEVSSNVPMHDNAAHRHTDLVSSHGDVGDQSAFANKGGANSLSKLDLQGKCSACASCCLSTIAFTSINLLSTPAAAGLTTTLAPEKRFTVNFPDGLERPPHTLPL